jgi:hypothetical protein
MRRRQFILAFLILFAILLADQGLFAQNLTQTIRGTVIDKETRSPLPGANVVILNSDPFQGTTTSEDGRFRLEKVKVGRQSIKVSFIGYEDYMINELEVVSAKENVLTIEMSEKVFTSKEVVILGNSGKDNSINEMSILSTRMFSVEETSKYAGAWGDPSRMASNFAGVTIVSDKRNDIIVRGNSPIGMLWRMDGMQIPNPNHFAIAGSSGGAISMINNNLLDNSDFSTGAFSAEYGNALSAVFDLKMRNGNNEKYEFLFQLGMQGVEAGIEGPFIKGKKSSFLINYRYSTLTLLNLIGIKIVDAVPNFQDLSFKMNFPYKKGNISWYGIGGKSNAEDIIKHDSTEWEYRSDQIGYRSGSQMATTGINWFHSISSKTYMKLMLTSSAFNPFTDEDSVGYDYEKHRLSRFSFTEMHNAGSLLFNTKISSRHILRYGVVYNNFQDWNGSYYYTYAGGEQKHIVNESDLNTSLLQGFFQWKFNIKENLALTTGAHALYLLLNNKASIEPRAALRWSINGGHALSFGFGIHGMMQPTSIYYAEVPDSAGTITYPNKSLSYTKAYHYVIGYDWMITENIRLKVEAYYQDIHNVPVSIDQPTLSLMNFGTDDNIFVQSEYRNSGLGRNYGIEITAEKFFSKGSYFLFTTSLFQSQYRDGNQTWRNTRYNSNYAANLLAGKEFKIGKKKNSLIGINTTIVFIGGQRYTPIDLDASRLAGTAVYLDSLAYSKRMKDFFKVDLRVRYRINSKHFSHEIAIEAANVLNRKNVESIFYNRNTGEIDYNYDLSLIPLVFYRLMF